MAIIVILDMLCLIIRLFVQGIGHGAHWTGLYQLSYAPVLNIGNKYAGFWHKMNKLIEHRSNLVYILITV